MSHGIIIGPNYKVSDFHVQCLRRELEITNTDMVNLGLDRLVDIIILINISIDILISLAVGIVVLIYINLAVTVGILILIAVLIVNVAVLISCCWTTSS